MLIKYDNPIGNLIVENILVEYDGIPYFYFATSQEMPKLLYVLYIYEEHSNFEKILLKEISIDLYNSFNNGRISTRNLLMHGKKIGLITDYYDYMEYEIFDKSKLNIDYLPKKDYFMVNGELKKITHVYINRGSIITNNSLGKRGSIITSNRLGKRGRKKSGHIVSVQKVNYAASHSKESPQASGIYPKVLVSKSASHLKNRKNINAHKPINMRSKKK